MKIFPRKRTLTALGTAAFVVVAAAAPSLADQIWVDGDGVGTVAANPANVSACTNKAVTFNVLIAARRNGNPSTNVNNNVFANSSTVTVAFVPGTSTPSGMSVSLPDSTIALPSDWQDLPTTTMSSEAVTATVTVPAQSAAGVGSAVFSFVGTNKAGSAVTGTSTMTLSWVTANCDSTPPVLALPGDITAEATSPSGAAVTYTATATDETAPAQPIVTCAPASGSLFALGTTTVNCSATDAAGNQATGSFNVTVQDTTAPTVGSMTNIAMEATGSGTVVSWTNPAASDVVSGTLPSTCNPPSGSLFPVGTTIVTCSATDNAGNTGHSTFQVIISDTTAPSLLLPADLTVEATGPSGAVATYAASASDLVDGPVTATCVSASGSTFALGATTVTCSATDAAGNTGSGMFTVTVVDTTPPDVTVPANLTVEATGASGAVATYAASSSDLVDGPVTATCVPASGSTFALGATTVTCSATDAAGNTGSGMFTVTVVDTTPPIVTVPANLTVEATGPSGALVTFTASATDLVDGSVTPTCVPASGTTFALGSHQVDCTAVDAAGNSATASFMVLVRDTTAPTITWVGGPADGASYAFGSVPAAPTCTASDLVDGTVICTVSGYSTAVGTHTLTATATDAAGNTATESRSYTVAAWTLKGFYQPVDMNGVWNTVKNGSTVPFKFEVFAGSTELTATTVVSSFTAVQVQCGSGSAIEDAIEEFADTGATTLRYDAVSGQFVRNWATPKKPGTCWKVTMTTQDGSSLSALFKLK